ncbi:MAG TPA: type II secretion system F family protein [Lichenihabitans sp.]|jgi:tight adherence protein B|nr:type II secretion system F family protein [Lichenihabitans sp.]
MTMLIEYGLVVMAAGGILFALMPYLSGDIKAEKRKAALETRPVRRSGGDRVVVDAAARRKQVADSLKDVEHRGRTKKLTLETKLARAGLKTAKRTYYMACGGFGFGLGLLIYLIEGSPVMAAAAMLVATFGIPNWIVGYLGKRRMNQFVTEFPNAVDIIIRGVKAGLPLNDCLRTVASECPEPLKTEFRRVVEAMTLGLSVTESVERMSESVPIPEASFFAIVIGIQQKAGGNLTEALTNLSRVIRERKKMKAKVKAVSSEAKTSAAIIGALPFLVGFFVYVTTPHYMEALWTTMPGRIAVGGCLVWMSLGIMIMKKMINFDI